MTYIAHTHTPWSHYLTDAFWMSILYKSYQCFSVRNTHTFLYYILYSTHTHGHLGVTIWQMLSGCLHYSCLIFIFQLNSHVNHNFTTNLNSSAGIRKGFGRISVLNTASYITGNSYSVIHIYVWLWVRLQIFNHIETKSLKLTVQSSSFLSLFGFQYFKKEIIFQITWHSPWASSLSWAMNETPQGGDLHLWLTLFAFMCLKRCRSNLILDTPDCFLPVGFIGVECQRGIPSVSPGKWFVPGGSHHPSKWRLKWNKASH